MKIYLDPGHGGTDPGAQGNGLNEKDVTLNIALKLRDILINEYQNVDVRMSRTGDTTKSLGQRTSDANAWGADFYLSIHINSASSAAQGYEDYIYNGLSDSSSAARYQAVIHEEVIKVNELADRGRKKANFHVLRESKMPAMLSENGFISNAHDSALMKQDAWLQKVARGHANGLARAFNLQRKANPSTAPAPAPAPTPAPAPANTVSGTLYKVMVGSFHSRENADERVARLRSLGHDAFVVTTTISGSTWYRVQVGAFTDRENAEQRLKIMEIAGFTDAFIIVDNSSSGGGGGSTASSGSSGGGESSAPIAGTGTNNGSGGSSPDVGTGTSTGTGGGNGPTTGSTVGANGDAVTNRGEGSGSIPKPQNTPVNSIFGPTLLSPEFMDRFVRTVNPDAPKLANYYLTFGEYYGIKGDIAFAQAIHETNFFRFTAVVKPGQDNFAGIGATGPDNPGASFQTPEEGVLAHMQHLYAYATTSPLPNQYPVVDPRFHLVPRGSAPTWTGLNGKWAVPGTTYGQSILDLYKRMVQFSIQTLETIRGEVTG
ncbi:N-acetylmuramoyl-L-alanine amidase [Neobacillus niacini]|uniref:N-acetylmuramoyl-L-alanine amidase n=1 Tax=Neobacillus niacini TaxID=86668 RepID=UPI0021CB92D0|nr:N-acetylmuramoyl-L-alanine amidase [Neobacillus niacini]MCM3763566.1 N-acetylmuramoyl-L-alanine amidase [Neobacillus niacini]